MIDLIIISIIPVITITTRKITEAKIDDSKIAKRNIVQPTLVYFFSSYSIFMGNCILRQTICYKLDLLIFCDAEM